MNTQEINNYLIEHHAFTKDGKLSSGITNYVNKHNKELYNDLKKITKINSNNLSQLLYHFINKTDMPKCAICNNDVKFVSYNIGYRKTCCQKCSKILSSKTYKENNIEKYGVEHPMQRQEVKDKIKQTCLNKYGVENPFQSEKIKDKIKQTCLDRYGVDNVSKFEKIKEKKEITCIEKYGVSCVLSSKEIIDKKENTNLKKYGNKCCLHNEEIDKKTKSTNLKKYGYERITQSPDFQKKIGESKSKHFYESLFDSNRITNITPLFSLEEYNGVRNRYYKFLCNDCKKEFISTLYAGYIPVCPDCFPKITGTSKYENEVYDFLCTIIDKNDVIKHNRTILGNKQELDFYIPKFNLAIEYNGLYVHSELNGKDKNYHITKTKLCESKGIHLIQINSNEWLTKNDIVKSYIKSCCNTYEKTIYARKCICKYISSKDSKLFLEKNHLQGFCKATYHLGLFFNDELISVISFSKPRFSKKENYDYEIIRYVNKLGYHIPGGFSKLLSYFRKEHNGSIITYSDRRLFTGNVYRNNGFIECEPTKPGYSYSNNDYNLINRLEFQKWKLLKKYGDKYKNYSELEIAHDLKFYRIYDCGNWKFYLNK